MRKVLIFKETLLPPSETFILAQAQALQRYQPVLVGLERCQPTLPVDQPLLLTVSPGRLARRRAQIYRRLGLAPVFHKRARQYTPDLIHAHFASGGKTAIPLARALKCPLIVTLHGADITVEGAAERYRELGRQAALFICVSGFIRERALQAGLPHQKLVLHYTGIDRTLFAPAAPGTACRVLFVGRLVEKKGAAYLISAMQQVQRKLPAAELSIVGDGPLRPQLELLAAQLKVSCTFHGTMSPASVQDQLQRAAVFCVPSVTAANGDSEGLGMVFAEAQAMGIPVVSTNNGGIPEVVRDGVTGLLVNERDPSALAAALHSLLADEALRRRFGSAAMAHIERDFDLYAQTARLEELYDDVADSLDRSVNSHMEGES